ncbi:hypothetical protein NE237_017400 [Protea cynaroides]|uniref:Uncharacterized protein n=1 Tax=Protea cynaroides TaxID=273540 RepID=A0A9Q0K821_9MAGN|nr:hypothetical protein NE237_017400 [Protea cynaroides]
MLNIIDLVRMRWICDFLSLVSQIIYAGIQYGQRQDVEGAVQNATHGSAEPTQQQNETQEETEEINHLRVHIHEAPLIEVNGACEAKILKATTILISVCIGGIFSFLQVQIGNEKIKLALKLNYFACNVSLGASAIVAILQTIAINFQRIYKIHEELYISLNGANHKCSNSETEERDDPGMVVHEAPVLTEINEVHEAETPQHSDHLHVDIHEAPVTEFRASTNWQQKCYTSFFAFNFNTLSSNFH